MQRAFGSCTCRYSYAETVTTPFVRRALVTLPHYKGVDPAAIAHEKGLDRLSAWFTVRLSPSLKPDPTPLKCTSILG